MNQLTVQEFARMGGNARAQKLSAKRRMEISKKATRALRKKARARRAGLTKP